MNNGGGGEFQLYSHPCYTFGKDSQTYMATRGHNGNMSPDLLKHMAEDLGFRYLSASDKEQFMAVLPILAGPEVTENN